MSDKLCINWKYCKSKILHLTYRASQLSNRLEERVLVVYLVSLGAERVPWLSWCPAPWENTLLSQLCASNLRKRKFKACTRFTAKCIPHWHGHKVKADVSQKLSEPGSANHSIFHKKIMRLFHAPVCAGASAWLACALAVILIDC